MISRSADADRLPRFSRIAAPLILAALLSGPLAILVSAPARAAPPPADSEDFRIMAPFIAWVRTQHDRHGAWCCDIGDGRPVEAQISGDHWEAHVTPEHFPTDTDRWITVPGPKVLEGTNPTGTAILWMLRGQVQCFAPPDGA